MEVQGLLQRRSVSSILQSAGFRRSLERVFRSHLGPRTRTSSTASPLARVSESASRTQSPQIPSRTESPAQIPSRADSPAQVVTNIDSTVRVTPQNNTQTNTSSTENNSRVSHQSIPTPPPPPAFTVQQDPNFDPQERFRRWNQDDFVMEISELVHRQLVSSTLAGGFRDRLENMVMVSSMFIRLRNLFVSRFFKDQ